MSKDKAHDVEAGGEKGSNIYYCPKCNEEHTSPPPRCPNCDTPLELKSSSPIDPWK